MYKINRALPRQFVTASINHISTVISIAIGILLVTLNKSLDVDDHDFYSITGCKLSKPVYIF